MCLMAMAWRLHPRMPLVLAANRDEFHHRPAQAMHWWDDGLTLAGRDLQAGGTWLGLSRAGRIGLLTNVREPGRNEEGLPSRGSLVPAWLTGERNADALSERLSGLRTNGYNLLGLDVVQSQAHCWSNRNGHAQHLSPGVYGLSNAALNTPWPKLERLKGDVQSHLRDPEHTPQNLADRLLQALTDRTQPNDEHLPRTGVPLDWERWLSSVFIRTPDGRYGTRCSTVIVVEQTSAHGLRLHAWEQSWDASGRPTTRVEQGFEIDRGLSSEPRTGA